MKKKGITWMPDPFLPSRGIALFQHIDRLDGLPTSLYEQRNPVKLEVLRTGNQSNIKLLTHKDPSIFL